MKQYLQWMKVVVFTGVICLFQSTYSHAAIRYVKTGSAGTAPYTSWATASNDLQAVINACSAGDEIWVAAGTYKPNRRADALTVITATNRNNAFVLMTGVKIYGGFTGTETLLTQRNVTANVVTLSGDIGTAGIDTDNCYHVVISSGNNNATRLDGVQVVLGNANGTAFTSVTVNTRTIYANRGGGIYAAASDAVFDECTIRRNNTSGNGAGVYDTLSTTINLTTSILTQNIAGNNGGGIYNAGSSPDITNCNILQNDAGNHGGGIFNSSSAPNISSCDIVQNDAINDGAGIYNLSSTPELNSNNIDENEAGNNGGGIYNSSSVNNITAGYITDNVAGNNGGGVYNASASGGTITNIKILNNTAVRGGAMYNSSSSPLITFCGLHNNTATMNGGAVYNLASNAVEFNDCSFHSNTATTSGGAIYYNGGTAPKVKNCSFKANSSNGNGGAVYIVSADVILINCLLSGNYTGASGGGFFIGASNPVLTNCTVVANKAVIAGGGFAVSNTCTLENSIVWGNTAGSGNNIAGGSLNITYSNIEGGAIGTGNINVNPLFISPEPSSSAPTLNGDYRVQKCSPVINAGSNVLIPGGISQDIDGNVRINYGIVDMGAYEKKLAVKAPTGIVYVDHTKTGNGSNWVNASPSLADALLTAKYDATITQIWVAKGTYYPEYNATNLASLVCNPANRYNSFVLVDDVKVYGGFENGDATLADRDIENNVTILSGDINTDNTSAGNTYHVVISAGAVGSAILDGFTITGGNADYSGNSVTVNGITVTSFYGGGMGISLSSPTINDCIIQGNYGDHGGAISVLSGAPVFNRCIIRNNVAGIFGGALDHWMIGPASNATFNNCLITGNRSNSYGGAFVNTSPSVIRLNNTTVVGNYAVTQGGGLWSNGPATEIFRNSIIWGNRVGATPSNIHVVGGGVVNATYCTVEGGYVGTGNISTNPLFVDEQPASAAPTMLGNYHLQKCSPAINVGSNPAVPAGITKDLDSLSRIHLGIVDMGAYEKHLAKPNANGIVYVDSSNTSTVGDGRSWAQAVTELADAVKEAKTNSDIKEIWVAKGTYKPIYVAADGFLNSICHTTDRDASFVLVPDVKLYGGFAGGEVDTSGRDFITNQTILSGDIGILNDSTDNTYHVAISADNVGLAAVDGVTIAMGKGISNCADVSSITVNGQIIRRIAGGGLNTINSSPLIKNVVFIGNTSCLGGAIFNIGSSLIISDCSFKNNNGLTNGGAYNNNTTASAIFTHCSFTENQSDFGGAISALTGLPAGIKLFNCQIAGNRSTFNGGGIYCGGSTILVNCIISGNSASGNGGGLYIATSSTLPVSISNCSISGNKSVLGGGICNTLSATNIHIDNSIIWGNNATTGSAINNAVPVVTFSLIEGGYAGTGNYNVDPMFISPESPASAPTASGDYRLQPCSPAINAGNNDSIPVGVSKDLDSLDRIRYTTVDMGAYEKQDIDLANTSWKGININWNDKINWCGGYIPYDTTNVIIPLTANQPSISSGYTNGVKNISLANGTSMSVAATSVFTVHGTYSNSGSIISNLGEWVMAGNAAAQSFPGTLGSISNMHTLRIKNPAGISLNKSFSITGALIPEAGNIELNNDTITLRSTATTTARIDSVRAGASFTYTGTGKFEIERYIPAKKAWRLLTAPVNAYQSINADWQEGQTNLSLVNSNTRPGYGTHISGPQTGSGFDFTNTNNPSMLVYDHATNSLSGIANTNVLHLNHRQGYMLFLHGSRAYDLTLNHLGTPDATVLRSRGTIKTGLQSVPVNATGFTLVGNPYASTIDFDQLSRLNVDNKFTLWDPNRAGSFGLGGYVTFTKVGASYVAAPSPASVGLGQEIQSGMAFFVEGTGTAGSVSFEEKAKIDASTATVFRSADSMPPSLRINLIKIAASTGIQTPLDGALVVFSEDAEQGIDPMDAGKKLNDNQNISFTRDGKLLAIEVRKPIDLSDTLFVSTTQLQQRSYVLELVPQYIARPGLQAFLADRYLNQTSVLSLTDTSHFTFTVNTDAASAAADRFYIVFQQEMAGPVPVRFTAMSTLCKEGGLLVNWTVAQEEGIENYSIEASADGRQFENVGQVPADGRSGNGMKAYHFIHTNRNDHFSFYRIRANGISAEMQYSSIVAGEKCNPAEGLYVYPNPVEESVIQLYCKQMPAGSYHLQLIDMEGKRVFMRTIQHPGGTKQYPLKADHSLPAGKYLLRVIGSGYQQTSIPVIIK